jgi:hypothetical protein
LYDDLLYYGETEKQRKRRKLAEARRKGKAGEEAYKFQAMLQGKEVKRTGRGHDFKETTRNLWTGKVRTKYVEVKTGKARLSKLQKRTKKKKKGAYKVVHEEPPIY